MYGYRARIGYTSPPVLTEVFPYDFYKMAPRGVTLVVTTLAILQMTSEELDESREISLRVARDMARGGVDVIVLGGVPVNLSAGFDQVERMAKTAEQEVGVPVTTSLKAQMAGLRTVGAQKIGVIQPFDEAHMHLYDYLAEFQFEVVGSKSLGYTAIDLGRIPLELGAQAARELVREHPDLDTLYLPCPHWAVVEHVEALEKELNVNIVASGQAIVWEALRLAGIDDRIEGFGRLFRDH